MFFPMFQRENIALFLLATIAFALPISTTLTIIAFILAVLWVLITPQKKAIVSIAKDPLVAACISFFAFQCLAAIHSTAPYHDLWEALRRGAKFAYLPFLTVLFIPERTRRAALLVFLASMMIVLIVGTLKYAFDLPWGTKYSTAAVFKDHIQTSALMAFAAFVAVTMAPHFLRLKKGLYILAAFMAFYIFFLNIGRSGYVSFIVLTLLWGFQRARWKGLSSAFLLSVILLGGAYWSASSFQNRVLAMSNEVSKFHEGEVYTSSGQRIGFTLNSWQLIKERPILGFGTGSFSSEYDKHFGTSGPLATDNPHNQYVLYGVELGIVGVLWLLFILCGGFYYARRLPVLEGHLLQGVIVMIGVGSLFNAWLSDTTETHLFIYFVALSIGSLFIHHEKKST